MNNVQYSESVQLSLKHCLVLCVRMHYLLLNIFTFAPFALFFLNDTICVLKLLTQ